jgi:hypothetical protein
MLIYKEALLQYLNLPKLELGMQVILFWLPQKYILSLLNSSLVMLIFIEVLLPQISHPKLELGKQPK